MSSMRKPTILCVDDEKMILDSLKEQLRRSFKNYSIETAESGKEAFEIVAELNEDGVELAVVISDHIMPGIKGDELLIGIHETNPETMKILLTGHADVQAVGNAINRAKLFRYISKPWEQVDLEMCIVAAAKSYIQSRQLIAKKRELEKRVTTFHKFVPSQFLEALSLSPESDDIRLGDAALKEMTVLFSDIRSFSLRTERLTPSESFEFINNYLKHMAPVIRENKGFIDKYIGDAIMALFDNADYALKAAISMKNCLRTFNKSLENAGKPPIKIGVGLNSGTLTLGTLGEIDRMQTTVMGDTVNIASRTESMTKYFGTPCLVTEHVVNKLKNPSDYNLRLIDRVIMKGTTRGVKLYEVLDFYSDKKRNEIVNKQEDFQKAVEIYRQGYFMEAAKIFTSCLRACERDNVVRRYLNLCRHHENLFVNP